MPHEGAITSRRNACRQNSTRWLVDHPDARRRAGDGPALVAPVDRRDQRGMVSAEWAVGIIAAIAIAGVLLAVVTSGPVEKAFLS